MSNLPVDLELYRVSGANNTFLICSLLGGAPGPLPSERKALAKKLCHDFFGFINDGLIFLEDHPSFDFKWDFYNADGSAAEMCGNAARCVALLYHHLSSNKALKCRFLSIAGPIEAEIGADHRIKVKMPSITHERDIRLKLQNRELDCLWLNTGVPHLVLEEKPDLKLAQEIRFHPDLGAAGVNVTFIQRQGAITLAETFERGVENFTQACGTGAVAAARFVDKKAPQSGPVRVQMPGGLLMVEFLGADKNQVVLEGQAQIEFKLSSINQSR